MIEFITLHKVEVLGALFLLSEFLAMFPFVKANSVFQFIYNLIKGAYDKLAGKSELPPA